MGKTSASALRTSDERYQAFIQNSHEGIWRVELDKPISTRLSPGRQIGLMYKYAYMAEANDAMAAMYGAKSPKELIGLRLGQLLIRDDPRNTAYLKAFIASGYNLSGVDSHEVDRHGNKKVFRNSLAGVIEDGMIVRAWGTQQDITTQYLAEEELRGSEERLALALKASRMGMWEWDIRSGELVWSDELKTLYGLKVSDTITYDTYVRLLHPADRPRMQHTIREAIKSGREYRVEHRIHWPDGSLHWILGQGKALFEHGKAVRMIGTSMSIDERKKAEEELKESVRLKAANAALKSQREQLVALNKSKDEFISLASHQLRTPATGVKQYIGMLLQGYAGALTKQQVSFLRIAYENNERQLRIIDDLLKVAQLDAGNVALFKRRTNITALIRTVAKEYASVLALRGQRLLLDLPPRYVYARVDAPRLRMVLENLVDNAAKYSKEDTTITVRLTTTEEQRVIAIEDQGVGIAKRDIGRLFQKFSRIDNVRSTLAGGTGIGLYWAKRIIDMHGGTIDVKSKIHRGSVFRIILPKAG